MVKYVFGLLFLTLIVLFEASVLPFFPVFNTQPSLLLVFLLSLQFLGFAQESFYGAFFGGILLDLLNSTTLGLSSLFLLLLVGAVGLARRVAASSPLILLLMTFVGSVVFRITQAFPTFNPAMLCKGGVLDVGMMLLVYPMLRYVLGSVFRRRELQVGV